MPYHSKWQDLPTEAINPATLGIDTMPVLDIIDLISAEDRRVVAAVHRERERIAHGVEIIVGALQEGRPPLSRRRRHERPARRRSRRPRCRRRSARRRSSCRPSWPAARTPCSARAKASRTTSRKAPAASRGCASSQARRHHRRVGQRHHAVRARRADRRAARRARASSSSPAGPAPSCRTSSI